VTLPTDAAGHGAAIAPELIADNAELARAGAELRSTSCIRQRADALLQRARSGASEHWLVNDAALASMAQTVAVVTRERYPELRIPFHSRWRHFEAGGVDRKAWLDQDLAALEPPARARSQIDLALVSVLLDAGAGPQWSFAEPGTGQRLGRSEGLGVASFHAFRQGLFSSDPDRPLQADAHGLQRLRLDQLGAAFQVTPANPLVGLEGRLALLQALGAALLSQPEGFGATGRPGHLLDALTEGGTRPTVAAHDVLRALLDTLSGIWPSPNRLGAIPLGDCWQHPAVRGRGLSDGWMPFHKLSQWLTYSLLEPLQWAGVQVDGLDALTGLPEYRNGGLLMDGGVLQLREPANAQRPWLPGDALIVEWRALTVALLDALAPRVRHTLGLSAEQMPLACVLEGGTWAAGRVLAQRLRGGTPPLNIVSDGTVF
jgi:hypothetical protein